MPKENAIEMMTEAATEPSLDGLGKRARAVLAMAAPSPVELEALVQYWRRQRASWGNGKEEKDD